MLEQMHAERGSVPQVERSVKESVERVRKLSAEIQLSEDQRQNLAREQENVKDDKNQDAVEPEPPTSTNPTISEETNNELPTQPEVPVRLPSTETDSAPKANFNSNPPITRPSMPDVVPELTPITPTKNDLTNIPDVLHPAVTRRRTPPTRKSPGSKPTRRRIFRLNTLQELQASKKVTRPLTWKEAGTKLAEIAGSWKANVPAIPVAANHRITRDMSVTRRRSSVPEENWDGGTTKEFVSGVVKIVSCVSLYLICRKIESLVK